MRHCRINSVPGRTFRTFRANHSKCTNVRPGATGGEREPDRKIVEEPGRRRRRGRPHHRARHRGAHPAAGAAVPGHRRAGHHHLHRLARGSADRGRVRTDRAAGAGAARPGRPPGDPVLRERRRRVHQPAVLDRHGHGPHADRRHRAHEPAAAAAARCRRAAHLARPGRRQRAERDAVLVLRAAEARNAGAGRELPARGRGPDALAHRVDPGRRHGQRQCRRAGRAAHRVRPVPRRGTRHPDPGDRGRRRQRRRRLGRLRRARPAPVHAALRGPLPARRPRPARARLARWPAGAPGRRRDDLGRARRPQLARGAEQQSRRSRSRSSRNRAPTCWRRSTR